MNKFKLYSGGRASGKTTQACLLVKKFNGVLAAKDDARKKKIIDMGLLDAEQIITYRELFKP